MSSHGPLPAPPPPPSISQIKSSWDYESGENGEVKIGKQLAYTIGLPIDYGIGYYWSCSITSAMEQVSGILSNVKGNVGNIRPVLEGFRDFLRKKANDLLPSERDPRSILHLRLSGNVGSRITVSMEEESYEGKLLSFDRFFGGIKVIMEREKTKNFRSYMLTLMEYLGTMATLTSTSVNLSTMGR